MAKTKLSGKFVIGFENDAHVIYSPGELVYEGNEILFVGNRYDGNVDTVYDFPLSIISPGFIDLDADIDTDHAIVDIAVPIREKDGFCLNEKFRTKDAFNTEDYRIRHQYSIAQLIKNGITTALPISGELFYGWGQSIEECITMSEVADEMGVRLYIGPSFKSRPKAEGMDDLIREGKSLEEAFDFCELLNSKQNDRLKPFINPCQINVTRLSVLKEACEYAKLHHYPFRLHACEGIREWNYTLPKYGMTTIDLFEKEGMLYDQFIIPHCITAKSNELKVLAQRGVSVISTPMADANVGTALFSFNKYLSYGINMTMGTDAQPTDMLRNMRMSWDLDRLCSRRKFFSRYNDKGEMVPLLPEEPMYPKSIASDYFNAATINGAKALKRTDIGHLSKGTKADIIVINLADLSVGPYQDPIRTMLNSCNGSHVTHTIIDGKMLMKDRVLLDIDEQKLLKDAQNVYDKFIRLYSEYDVEHRNSNVFFPDSYKTINGINN